LRQNPVEYQTARGGQQPRTSSPRRRQTAALGPVARLIDITAIPTKTLGAEIVRHAAGSDALQARVQGFLLGLQAAQADDEAIGTVGTALQLAGMTLAGQAAQVVIP